MVIGSRLPRLLLVATVLLAAPACASGVLYPQRYPVGDRDDRAYYNRGFREGQEAGIEDVRRGRSYNVRRHDEYRDNRRGNDRGDLRAFRDGFEAGYDEAYRRLVRGDYGRDPRRDAPRAQGPYVDRDARSRIASPAADRGYRDGFDAGQRAARNGDRYDPVREKRYREGDHDYEGRDGSREVYKREYRDAFQQGYDAGFRGGRR